MSCVTFFNFNNVKSPFTSVDIKNSLRQKLHDSNDNDDDVENFTHKTNKKEMISKTIDTAICFRQPQNEMKIKLESRKGTPTQFAWRKKKEWTKNLIESLLIVQTVNLVCYQNRPSTCNWMSWCGVVSTCLRRRRRRCRTFYFYFFVFFFYFYFYSFFYFSLVSCRIEWRTLFYILHEKMCDVRRAAKRHNE